MSLVCFSNEFPTKKAITVTQVLFKGKGNTQRGRAVSLLSIREVCLGPPTLDNNAI